MRSALKRPPILSPIDFSWVLKNLQADEQGFLKLARILKTQAGINLPLNDKNLSLMAGRLNPILREHAVSDYQDYLEILLGGEETVLREFISAMATNTTEFFRESNHFTLLREVIGKLIERKRLSGDTLRIWCAAASTGQEPFSIAMTALEAMGASRTLELRILATDIDENALERATQGVYSAEELKTVPALYRQKYFFQVHGQSDRTFFVQKALSERIHFARFNLLTEVFPFQHPFDIIFCRNVLIYFERETSQAIVHKLAAALGADGHLFVGHSETGMVRTPLVEPVAGALYRKVSKDSAP